MLATDPSDPAPRSRWRVGSRRTYRDPREGTTRHNGLFGTFLETHSSGRGEDEPTHPPPFNADQSISETVKQNKSLFSVLKDSNPTDAESGTSLNGASRRMWKSRVYKGKTHNVWNFSCWPSKVVRWLIEKGLITCSEVSSSRTCPHSKHRSPKAPPHVGLLCKYRLLAGEADWLLSTWRAQLVWLPWRRGSNIQMWSHSWFKSS